MPTNTERSGGSRYSSDKPSGWWYVPMYGLRLVADVAKAGAEKYAPLDWREGQSFSTLFDCMSRHFLEVQEKGIWAKDPELGTFHLAQLTWNALCLLTFMALGRGDLDDMTPWRGVTASKKKEVQEQLDVVQELRWSGGVPSGSDNAGSSGRVAVPSEK